MEKLKYIKDHEKSKRMDMLLVFTAIGKGLGCCEQILPQTS